jgi:hypothetical protein
LLFLANSRVNDREIYDTIQALHTTSISGDHGLQDGVEDDDLVEEVMVVHYKREDNSSTGKLGPN